MEHPGRLLVPCRHFLFFFARRAELDWAMDVSCLSGSGRFSSVFSGVAHVKGSMGGSSDVHFPAVGLISPSVNEG